VAPWGTFAVAHSRPPWASMIERQIESPIPMPLDLVVKKAVNSRSASSAEIPTPQSVTLTSACSFSSRSDRITSSRGRSVTDCIASMPFITRLIIMLQLDPITQDHGSGCEIRPQRHPLTD
jgi:hypothetical protein